MQAVGLYENRDCIYSSESVHRSRGAYALTSAVSTFGTEKRARTAETVGSEKTNQSHTDYPDNDLNYLPPRHESILKATPHRDSAADAQ